MELAPKISTSLMITLLCTSIAMGSFAIFKENTKSSMQNATTIYETKNKSMNDMLIGKKFPVIAVENQRITLNATYNPKSWVQVTDIHDGNITNKVEIYDKVDKTTKGDYEIRYVVRNSYGLKSVKKIKVIVD